jgi:hypothetical protein
VNVADGLDHGVIELVDVVGDVVGQGRVFGVAPESLDRIEVGCISGQPLDVEPRCAALMQATDGRPMDVEPIQNDDQRSLVNPMQLPQVPHHVARPHVAVLHDEVGPNPPSSRREAQTADDAQPIMTLRDDLFGPRSDGSPGAAIQRLQAEAGFIEKDERRTPSPGLFLIRGQSCERHRSIAGSFRSLARRCGFCGLNPRSCKMRPRWSGWYSTSNSRRTSSATRAQVHSAVSNPAARGPSSSNRRNRSRCDEVNFVGGPGRGCGSNAAAPPSRKARFQRLTLDKLTPNTRATSAIVIPFPRNSTATRRRTILSAEVVVVVIHRTTVLANYLVRNSRREE